jgi:hypothetical protein
MGYILAIIFFICMIIILFPIIRIIYLIGHFFLILITKILEDYVFLNLYVIYLILKEKCLDFYKLNEKDIRN